MLGGRGGKGARGQWGMSFPKNYTLKLSRNFSRRLASAFLFLATTQYGFAEETLSTMAREGFVAWKCAHYLEDIGRDTSEADKYFNFGYHRLSVLLQENANGRVNSEVLQAVPVAVLLLIQAHSEKRSSIISNDFFLGEFHAMLRSLSSSTVESKQYLGVQDAQESISKNAEKKFKHDKCAQLMD